MKQHEYMQAMDDITAPYEATRAVLEKVRTADLEQNEISLSENKRRKPSFRWAAAAAAVLVVSLLCGAIFWHGGSAPDASDAHGFVIKAGAAEVNPDYYVEIGEMKQNGASWEADWDTDEDGEKSYLNYSRLYATVAYTIDNLKCYGEGVDYYTYTVAGGYLIFDGRSGEVMTVICNPDGEPDMEITADGQQRFTLTDEEYNAFIAFGYGDDTGKYQQQMGGNQGYDENGDHYIVPDYSGVYYDMFNENAEDRYMLITAHYEDGTTLSKKLIFELIEKAPEDHDEEDIMPRYYLTAKLAD